MQEKTININEASPEIKAAYHYGFERGYKQSVKDNEHNDLIVGFFIGCLSIFVWALIIFS